MGKYQAMFASRSAALLQENLRAKKDELLSSAKVDSHAPIDYNYGKQVFQQFRDLYIAPILRRLGLGGWQKEKPM